MDKKALIELAKSTGRFIWFGLLGVIVTALTALLTAGELQNINVVVGGLEVNLSFVVLGLITALIKLIDRYRHVSENTTSNGIAPRFLQGQLAMGAERIDGIKYHLDREPDDVVANIHANLLDRHKRLIDDISKVSGVLAVRGLLPDGLYPEEDSPYEQLDLLGERPELQSYQGVGGAHPLRLPKKTIT